MGGNSGSVLSCPSPIAGVYRYAPSCSIVNSVALLPPVQHIVHSAGVGTVFFMPHFSGPEIQCTQVLHVPALSCNLFSVLHLVRFNSFVVRAVGTAISFSLAGRICSPNPLLSAILPFWMAQLASTFRVTLPLNLSLWHRCTMHHHLGGLRSDVRVHFQNPH